MRTLTLLTILLVFLLGACGGGFDEEDFASAIENAFEDAEWGDFNEQVCDRDEVDVDTEAGTEDVEVECSLDGSSVDCDITSNDSDDTMQITAVLDDDEKACDVTLVLPTGEMSGLNEAVIDMNDPIFDELDD
jgi:hypothetical protein